MSEGDSDELSLKLWGTIEPSPELPVPPPATVYVELLLHQTPRANLYYTSFQRHSPQFLESPNGPRPLTGHFSLSRLHALLKSMVQTWEELDYDVELTPGDRKGNLRSHASSTSGASSLFSWSSSDKYIAARKKELQRMKASGASTRNALVVSGLNKPEGTKSPDPTEALLVDLPRRPPTSPSPAPQRPKISLTRRLDTIVEQESNKFIQDRIALIRAHHLEQVSRKVDERRRKEHERQLRRLQVKEDKYEKQLRAAIAMHNTKRNSRFLGSLFGGSKSVSKSFVFKVDTDTTQSANDEQAEDQLEPSNADAVKPDHQNATSPAELSSAAESAPTEAPPSTDNLLVL